MFLPSGYITVADAIDADQFFFSEVDHDRDLEESIYALGVCLAGGDVDTFGFDADTSKVLPLPKSVWSQRDSRVLMERRPHFIDLKSPQGCRALIPLLDVVRLSERYDPPDLFMSCIPAFDPAKWDWKVAPVDNEAKEPTKNTGGRPAEFMWQDFWIEVALFADKESLTDGTGDWSLMRQHMVKWVADKWRKAPDPSHVNKKLASLRRAWEARQYPARN